MTFWTPDPRHRLVTPTPRTLVEFLAALKGAPQRQLVMATLFWLSTANGGVGISVGEIREAMQDARVKGASKINVSAVLLRSDSLVDCDRAARIWRLTDTGRRYITDDLGLHLGGSMARERDAIRSVVATVGDDVAKEFVEESVVCLEAGALRAAVVFLWSGAIRTIQGEMLTSGLKKVTQAVHRHDQSASPIKKIEDFAKVKDRITLLAARELALIGVRNHCGHPTKYKPGAEKFRAYIEDLVGIVFK